MNSYIFNTARLGFRNWQQSDITQLMEINNDDEVMTFFPKKPSFDDTINFVKRMQYTYLQKKYCYFAVDILDSGEFIGFIGLAEKNFPSDFTPCVDIGWRLKRSAWNKGLATEGAKACLAYAFKQLSLDKLIAITPSINTQSQRVMEKIGMKKVKDFEHPELTNYPNLRNCVLFSITEQVYRSQAAENN